MWHSTATPHKSVVDGLIDICASATPPEHSGVAVIRATVPVIDDETGEASGALEHVWLRDRYETERDFVAQAMAAARELGVRAVRAQSLIEVPE